MIVLTKNITSRDNLQIGDSSTNVIYTTEVSKSFVNWEDDTDFNKGSYTDAQVLGVNSAAVVQLKENASAELEIGYTTPADYTISDSSKINITGGVAMLYTVTGTSFLHYRLDENSGTAITDYSGNGRNATAVNIAQGNWSTGKVNYCIDFSASASQYLYCGSIANWGRFDTFSMDAWIYHHIELANWAAIISHEDDLAGTFTGWWLGISLNGTLNLSLIKDVTIWDSYIIKATPQIPTSTWTHVAVTYNASPTATAINFYINGSLCASSVTINNLTGTIGAAGAVLAVGCTDMIADFFPGKIDEVALYDYVLTEAQVKYRYNNGVGRIEGVGEYSTSDDLYIETKAATQIAPATNTRWISFTSASSKPTNTDIRVQFSTDNRTSWLRWDTSGTWITASSATRAEATETTTAATNFGSLPLVSGTCDVRVFLYTSDRNTSSSLDSITIEYCPSVTQSGEYVSNEYDSSVLSQDWDTINFNVTTPTGTAIVIRARAGNYTGALGSYSSALTQLQDTNLTGQYLQWKAELTGTSVKTPHIDWNGFNFSTILIGRENP